MWLPVTISTTQWQAQGRLACIRLAHDIWSLYSDHMQGLETRVRGIPSVDKAMSQQVWLWDAGIQMIDRSLVKRSRGRE